MELYKLLDKRSEVTNPIRTTAQAPLTFPRKTNKLIVRATLVNFFHLEKRWTKYSKTILRTRLHVEIDEMIRDVTEKVLSSKYNRYGFAVVG